MGEGQSLRGSIEALISPDAKDLIPTIGHRLPTHLIPASYHLTISIYLPGFGYDGHDGKSGTFDGEIEIFFKNVPKTRMIVLHSDNLTIHQEKSYAMTGDQKIGIRSIEYNTTSLQTIIELEKSVKADEKASLKLFYAGYMTSERRGVVLDRGEASDFVFTNLETQYSRRMAPCFDEPSFKATWKISVIHPKGTVALSNAMELDTVPVGDQFLRTNFKDTPILPTYTISVTVSDHIFMEKISKKGVRVRVYAPAKHVHKMQLTLDTTCEVIDRFETLFKAPHGMEKLDWFSVGQMGKMAAENFGLITGNDRTFQFDPMRDTLSVRSLITHLIVHELGHTWFGNLVTMKWWNELWLNEGFASYYEAVGSGIDAKRMDDMMFCMDVERVFSTPIRRDPMEQVPNYDRFMTPPIYKKAASVISMLRQLIGEETFTKSIGNYVQKNLHKNADTETLLENFPAEVKGVKMSDFLGQWVNLAGIPTIHVDEMDGKWIVDRNRSKGFDWTIPIWYTDLKGSNGFDWLKEKSIEIPKKSDLLIMDPDFTGVYTIQYSRKIWDQILQKMKTSTNDFPAKSRVRIMYELVTSSYLDDDFRIKFLDYLVEESSATVWNLGLAGKTSQKVDEKFLEMSKKRLEDRLGEEDVEFFFEKWQDRQHLEKIMDLDIIVTRSCPGHSKCSKVLINWFKKSKLPKCTKETTLHQCAGIPPWYRKEAYGHIVKNLEDPMIPLDWFGNEKNERERNLIGESFNLTTNVDFWEKLSDQMTSVENSKINGSDVHHLLESYFSGADRMSVFVKSLTKKCDPWPIVEKFGDKVDELGKVIRLVIDRSTDSEKEKLKKCCDKSGKCEILGLAQEFL